jgi:hypothetical protein
MSLAEARRRIKKSPPIMETPNQLASRFREVLLNGKWVANTNYQKNLSDLTWQQATTSIGSLNTIALLTFHVNYYLDGINQVFAGGPLEIRDKYSFDMPEVQSEAAWQKLRNELLANAEIFANHIEQLSDENLVQPFVDEKYGTYQRNIEGTIEHCYYHLGQISLLKKMILETK